MRILWLSNPPGMPTGYGEQTSLFLPRLQAMGHQMAVACNAGVHGMKLDAGSYSFYPADGDWGNRMLETYVRHHRADLVIALCDAWVLRPDAWPNVTVAAWAPVDHRPLPPPVHAVLSQEQIRPVAMSRFGERMMLQAGLEPLYVPHAVDTSLYQPRPEIKGRVRDELGIPRDAFLAGMVAANKGNPSRKAFPQAFQAFAAFAADHQDAWLYAHTEMTTGKPGDIRLDRLATAAGMPLERVRFPDLKLWNLGPTSQAMANLYQAFDVLLMPSMGEGFGIPLIEAQASGVPVIATDHSAMSELAPAGWLVGGDPWWTDSMEAFLAVPSVAAIIVALEQAYDAKGDKRLREIAVEFANGYDADLVADRYWRPALDQLGGQIELVAPKPNRKQRRAMAKA